jgi:sugar/nucleoside kinase (ribokinase family)
MDREEALKISGTATVDDAASFFISSGTGAFIITNGANPVLLWSSGRLFKKHELSKMHVSSRVTEQLRSDPGSRGDTTGCGDNFAGGVIVSLARQLRSGNHPDLAEAVSWGIASGGFCCFYVGGTYLEKKRGEKLEKVKDIQSVYFKNPGPDGKN